MLYKNRIINKSDLKGPEKRNAIGRNTSLVVFYFRIRTNDKIAIAIYTHSGFLNFWWVRFRLMTHPSTMIPKSVLPSGLALTPTSSPISSLLLIVCDHYFPDSWEVWWCFTSQQQNWRKQNILMLYFMDFCPYHQPSNLSAIWIICLVRMELSLHQHMIIILPCFMFHNGKWTKLILSVKTFQKA